MTRLTTHRHGYGEASGGRPRRHQKPNRKGQSKKSGGVFEADKFNDPRVCGEKSVNRSCEVFCRNRS